MTKCKDCQYLKTKEGLPRITNPKLEIIYLCHRPNLDGVEVLIRSDLDKECPYGY